MTTAILRPLPRRLLIGALALAGTLASFAMTVTPVQAAAKESYSVTLAQPLDAPRRAIVSDTMWRCEGARCSAPANGERAKSICAKVAREFGQVSRFEGPQGELAGDDLARCNAGAISKSDRARAAPVQAALP
jgi:hypothetical protein